jgi:hypothetical protein
MTRTAAGDVVEIDGIELTLTHRDKVLFPAGGIPRVT